MRSFQTKSKLFLLFVFMIVVGLGIISCSKEVASGPNFVFRPSPSKGVVAKIAGKEITEKELLADIEAEIFEAERKVYELKFNKIKAMVLEKYMEADPNKKGLTNDQFMDKYIATSVKIDNKAIEQFIKEKKIPDEHVNDEIKQRIKSFLEMEEKRKAVDVWLGNKTKNEPIEVYLDRPQRPVSQIPLVNDESFKGGASAKVVVVEYSDFQCPFCAKGSDLIKELLAKYGDKVKIIFKHFPLPFHTQAHDAAQASLCAKEQDAHAFWKMHDEFFADQTKLSVDDMKKTAVKIGLKADQFNQCLDSKKYSKAVDDSIAEGKKVGVKSTPTFYVNGKLVNGAQPLEVFAEIIDEELAAK